LSRGAVPEEKVIAATKNVLKLGVTPEVMVQREKFRTWCAKARADARKKRTVDPAEEERKE